MTVIQPNSITGVSSITALGSTLELFQSDGTSIANFTTGISTVSTLSATNSNVTGVSTVASLVVSGAIDANGNLDVDGLSDLDELNVAGISTFGANVQVSSGSSIGIGTASPRVAIDAAETTNAIALPQGTTAQRPTGSNPYIRWNTTNSALEIYDGTNWVEIITDYFPSGSTILG